MPDRRGFAAAALFVCLCGFAQNRSVSPGNQHERIIALVPFIGTGTTEDPRRPMFTPLPGQVDPGAKTGIIGFHFVPTDDGQSAIVELIARDRAAFTEILANTNPQVLVFLKGRDLVAAIELEMQKHKSGFTLRSFGEVVVP